MENAMEMLDAVGLIQVTGYNRKEVHIGLGIHEMGTARMGNDPKTFVLNKFNQMYACKNIFVADGAAMTSASCVNLSLTYMALTAIATDYTFKGLKNKEIENNLFENDFFTTGFIRFLVFLGLIYCFSAIQHHHVFFNKKILCIFVY